MKRKLLLFLAIAATVALQASDICIDGIYYLFEGDEAVVTYKGAIHYEDMEYYHDTVVIPSSVVYESKTYPVTKIGDGAFWICNKLTHVVLPTSVKVIGTSAFYGAGLKEVIIPDGVDSIASYAFYDVFYKKLTIGKGLRVFAISAISGNSMLAKIEISPCNPYYTSGDNSNAIIDRQTKKLVLGCENTTIPTYVTSIGESAFYYCSGLKSITIPQNVVTIGAGAFDSCYKLEDVILGRSVQSIGSLAFNLCVWLTNITCYSSKPPVFEDGDYAFGDEEEIYIEHIYVPKGSKGTYKTTIGWENYDCYDEITIPADAPEDVMPPVKCEETDLDIIPANNKLSTRKVIRNGRLFLYNNEHIYTITGAKLQFY
ncbi:MAG: leucine-rich repeat domain-containing protein [Paludibacteraceae bacterium]|nr:leucine-rich repeat domain-containing protein [Paludibacteraceae bacterium]